jgi:hypothetical protein
MASPHLRFFLLRKILKWGEAMRDFHPATECSNERKILRK